MIGTTTMMTIPGYKLNKKLFFKIKNHLDELVFWRHLDNVIEVKTSNLRAQEILDKIIDGQ